MMNRAKETYLTRKELFALSNEELVTLYQNDINNKEIVDVLYRKISGLLHIMAIRFLNAYGHSLDYDDLFQIGALVFLKTIHYYNKSRSVKFSSYLAQAITYEIMLQIGLTGFIVKIPGDAMLSISKISRLNNEYGITIPDINNRIPKIAKTLNIKESKVKELLLVRKKYMHYASLNQPVNEIADDEFLNFVRDEDITVEEKAMHTCLSDELYQLINSSNLTAKEKEVVKLRYWKNKTLEDIGSSLNITRERVRQIESKAIRKLRRVAFARHLNAFLV